MESVGLLAIYFSSAYRTMTLTAGFVWLMALSAAILVTFVVIPDALYVYGGLYSRNEVNNNFRWLRDYPELRTR